MSHWVVSGVDKSHVGSTTTATVRHTRTRLLQHAETSRAALDVRHRVDRMGCGGSVPHDVGPDIQPCGVLEGQRYIARRELRDLTRDGRVVLCLAGANGSRCVTTVDAAIAHATGEQKLHADGSETIREARRPRCRCDAESDWPFVGAQVDWRVSNTRLVATIAAVSPNAITAAHATITARATITTGAIASTNCREAGRGEYRARATATTDPTVTTLEATDRDS
mmetsp:Transcript_45263/g.108179  ORF Transcript_45263/g.108179 Transcript_45263/m.108179 type:complete len:224 (-) Transcript_45263:5433-6104(-)